ncbi:MAG: spore coat protein CotJB [Bacilli bacterium]
MYFDERENLINYASNETLSNKEEINNINIDNVIINNYRSNKLRSLEDGFNKGNMFYDLYEPYKNYDFKIVVNNNRDELLLKLQQLSFAVNDINLLLDLYPSNKDILEVFNDYSNKLNSIKNEYNSLYSPISATDNKNTNHFDYVNNPWPWCNGGINV